MTDTRSLCHLLYTDLVLASGSTEWEVEYRNGYFVATTNDPDLLAPPPIRDASESSRNVWQEWFRCMRG